jgi:integrase
MEAIRRGILSPGQFRLLLEQPRQEMDRIRMEFLLNTGMRYVEAQSFRFKHFNPEARKIHKPLSGRTRKQRERSITLTPQYAEKLLFTQRVMKLSPSDGLGFPPLNTFQKNLQYWFRKAGLRWQDEDSPEWRRASLVKVFRKTRESWLVVAGYDSALIALDQGHTNLTQLRHYLNNPFSQEDIAEIKEYMKGWQPL